MLFQRLVITHKARLLRFGAELIFSLCEHFGTEIVIINASEEASLKMTSFKMFWKSLLFFLQDYTVLVAEK